MSIKPVAKLRTTSRGWDIRPATREICAMPNGERNLYAIPDTHRVVPIWLLERVINVSAWNEHEAIKELRAIIEDKP